MENSRKIVIETTLTVNHKTIQTTDRIKIIIKIDPVILLKKRNNNYQNRLRNYSQLSYQNNSKYSDRQNQNYKISTTKNQRQFYHVQPTNQTIPEPPGIDNTETSRDNLVNYTVKAN